MKEKDKNLCAKCSTFRIVNKTYRLCNSCNFERLHPGETYYSQFSKKYNKNLKKNRENRINSMKDSLIKTNLHSFGEICSITGCTNKVSKSRKDTLCLYHSNAKKRNENKREKIAIIRGVKKQTKQQKKENSIKNELSSIKKEAKINHGTKCEGCLKHFENLDYSHILSVGQRKDLEIDRDNKNLLCRLCHIKWESRDSDKMISLDCFYDNMKYIRKHDTKAFWKIYFIFNDAMKFKECKEIESIDNDFIKQSNE